MVGWGEMGPGPTPPCALRLRYTCLALQVRWDQSHAFWEEVIGYGYRESNLRAMVIDMLQIWYEVYRDRLNNTHRHETWMVRAK